MAAGEPEERDRERVSAAEQLRVIWRWFSCKAFAAPGVAEEAEKVSVRE